MVVLSCLYSMNTLMQSICKNHTRILSKIKKELTKKSSFNFPNRFWGLLHSQKKQLSPLHMFIVVSFELFL